MWRVLVLTISLIANVNSIQTRWPYQQSAASRSQIKFAIENNYDDTGPGAKGPEYAYQTYKTLEEALVSYFDDPDTKLPEYEREKAIGVLQGTNPNNYLIRERPKTVEEYTGYTEPVMQQMALNQFNYLNPQVVYRDPTTNYKYTNPQEIQTNDIPPKKYLNVKVNQVIGYQRGQPIKGSKINLAQYVKDPDVREAHDQFDPNPRYSFSYGVHDKKTGDTKSAHEVRDGGNVRGYYSFIDADGKQRTVHYIADDKEGFRATVHRTHG
ncbi:unnamed protein product [Euphydryas editha]|uniref:Uncharacterized protein n=1 Tax=Euphydryas editha TaxID=104508 RepID=A0AAU9TK96_EUPED|nr:unnamed protein product [Euphydryas editha]